LAEQNKTLTITRSGDSVYNVGASMKIARAIFIAWYRVPHACLSMQFDHYLENIDHTYIFTNVNPPDVLSRVLQKYSIDLSKITIVHDDELNARYPTIKNWFIPGDFRGSWLYQQALKLASLDYIDADVILIQDPDSFSIKPYNCLDNENPKFFILPNETHSNGYYQVLENSLGIPRQTPHCFVTEFMPVFKEDWQSLRQTLEQRNQCDVFDAIINNVPYETSFPPAPPGDIKWFSEYEFLGNWTMTQRPIKMLEQKRFQYKTIDELDNLTDEYNCVCDACPNLEDSICWDSNAEEVLNFENIFNKVKKFL